MNKEEILNKSRQSNNDEWLEYIENKWRKIGYSIFAGVSFFILIFSFFTGQENDAVFALVWTFGAAENTVKYQFTRDKGNLILAVASLILTILSLINFVSASLR